MPRTIADFTEVAATETEQVEKAAVKKAGRRPNRGGLIPNYPSNSSGSGAFRPKNPGSGTAPVGEGAPRRSSRRKG